MNKKAIAAKLNQARKQQTKLAQEIKALQQALLPKPTTKDRDDALNEISSQLSQMLRQGFSLENIEEMFAETIAEFQLDSE